MRKNVILPIIAVGVAPVSAFAEASLSVGTNGTPIVSSTGAPIEIGPLELYPGKYTVTTEGATGGAVATIDGEAKESFELKATTTVKIGAKSEAQTPFSIQVVTVTLNYDFKTAAEYLTTELGKAFAGVDESAINYEELSKKNADIAKKIQEIKNEEYTAYITYQLYNGVENCPIVQEIENFAELINVAGDNAGAFNAANAAYNVQVAALSDTGYDKLADGYVKNIQKANYDAAKKVLDDFKKQIDDANKAGNAAAVCTTEAIDAFTKSATEAIKKLTDGIAASIAADEAYKKVTLLIQPAQELFNTAAAKVIEKLTSEYKKNYAPMLEEAQKKLNDQLVIINKAAALNGDDANHENAAENEEANTEAINAATTEINTICNGYMTKFETCVMNYKTATGEVVKLEKALKIAYGEDKTIVPDLAKDIEAVEKLINDLKAKIENDHNSPYNIETADYSKDYTEITNKTEELEGKASPIVANDKAYKANIKSITDVQKVLDEAKAAVAKLTSADKKYTAAGKYAEEEKTLQDAIDKMTTDNNAAYDKGTATGYTPDVDGNNTNIAGYKTTAENALKAYDAASKAVSDMNTAYSALDKKATNKNVTTAEGKTYKQELADAKTAIDAVQKAIDDALKLSGNKHAEALGKITWDGELVGKMEALTKAYDENASKYNDEAQVTAAKKMLDAARARLTGENGIQQRVNSDLEKTKTCGLSAAKLEEALKGDKIQGEINKQKTAIDAIEVPTKENALEAMALLADVNDAITKIEGELANVENDIKAAQDKVKANKAQHDVAVKTNNAQNLLINGGLDESKNEVLGIKALSKDPDWTKTDHQKVQTDLKTELVALMSEVNKALAAETLVDDWNDTEKDGKVVKGFDTKFKELADKIAKARVAAEKTAKNYDAKNAINKYVADAKIGDAITKAANGVKAIKDQASNAGQNHYLDLLGVQNNVEGNYTAMLAKIKEDITKAYGEEKAVDAQNGIEARVDNLVKNVNKVVADAEANNKANNELLKMHKETNELWAKVYAEISNADMSSALIEYQKQLSELQTELIGYQAEITQAFGEGRSTTAAVNNLLAKDRIPAIKAEIEAIKKAQQEGYDEAIEADNDARYADFQATVSAADAAFIKAVNDINELRNVQNEELLEKIKAETMAASEAIYAYADKIRELKDKAATEYSKVKNAEETQLYDYDRQNENTAGQYAEEIAEALTQNIQQVKATAVNIYTDKHDAAKTALDDAVANLKYTPGTSEKQYAKDVVYKAFNDVRTIIKNAENLNQNDPTFAAQLDRQLDDLDIDNINKLIEAGIEPAAQAEWSYQLTKANEEITNAGQLGTVTVDGVTTDYEKLLQDNIKESKTAALAKVDEMLEAKKPWTEILPEAVKLLDSLKAAELKKEYEAGKKLDTANGEAADKWLEGINDLEKDFNKALAFAEAYVGIHTESLQNTINNAKNTLDKERASAEYAKANGGAIEKLDNFDKTGKKVITTLINSIYPQANDAEKTSLTAQIQVVQKDFNEAYKVNPDNAALKDFQDKIDNLLTEITNVEKLDPQNPNKTNEDIQKGYLAIEKKMAEMRNELAEINGNNAAAVLSSLEEALAKVKADNTANTETNSSYDTPVNELFKGEIDGYTATLADIESNLAKIEADIEAAEADNSVLFNNEKLQTYIDNVAKEVANVAKNINDLKKKSDDNKAAFEKLTADLQAIAGRKDAIATTIDGYQWVDVKDYENVLVGEKNSEDEFTSGFGYDYPLAEAFAQAQYDAVKATSDDLTGKEDGTLAANTNYKSIKDALDKAEKKASYDEARFTINVDKKDDNDQVVNNTLQAALDKLSKDIEKKIADKLIVDSENFKVEDIRKEVQTIGAAIKALVTYNGNAYNGSSDVDIDGNPIMSDGAQITTSVNYMEVYGSIMNKVTTITEQMGALDKQFTEQSFVKGDVDGDNTVDVSDLTTLRRMILELSETPEKGSKTFAAADANSDGKLTIGDVTGITRIILGETTVTASYARTRVTVADAANDALSVTTEGEGVTQRIVINLDNAVRYVAGQMDITLPAGITLVGESLGERASGHELMSNNVSNGSHRVLISSLENAEFDGNNGALLYLDVNVSPRYNGEGITISNVEFADRSARSYAIGGGNDGSTGIGTVTATEYIGAKIYSVGGQLRDAVKKGINIIRNSDGSSKKVIKK